MMLRLVHYARRFVGAPLACIETMPNVKPRAVACPKCGTPVVWTAASKWRPFCSERCRTLDQGAWASESYRVPTVDPPDDFDAEPPEKET